MQLLSRLLFLCFILSFTFQSAFAQTEAYKQLEGRWDLTVQQDGKELPSWLEISHSGNNTLVGRFVYAFGSARPVAHVKYTGTSFTFSIPKQWEDGDVDMAFKGKVTEDDKMVGTMRYVDGKTYNWTGTRAPKLVYTEKPIWGAPRQLFNGENLDGWHASGDNQWTVENGVLTSKASGSNIISDEKFMDFKLHIEFRYPEKSNSGVYLRGRYEVQVEDNIGKAPTSTLFAGIYGFLTPNIMAAKPAGEWQAYDITLIGNRVTVIANGHAVIVDQTIPGITGGALDSNESEPGSFMLQGDHGPIEYRNIVVTPMMKAN
ncbi:MAG: DUF1080 domain-containing protein [Saprospiraceae bacterium]